ncbi:Tol-Pal system beta propeller repeat protein TolB [Spartinivicinus poritis]|uniref:Tol-Pal system protein TolB n=1 Tax=Spartinivicinus poritis TaxID=2994640 RepID=A0ABT5U7J6_9GAMM|nr:Tol-Pal system beta propeller repeat protein TolB [Spartinivicinus sp. A2-2]MDE1462349.1 Tol-Pal system beta propeller repeat protein TolB [Spartinivicinus sp. A2-2]
MIGRHIKAVFTALLLVFMAQSAWAGLTIEITKGNDSAVPIAVVPFGGDTPPHDVAEIIGADLKRSGLFEPFAPGNMLSLPQTKEDVVYSDWRKSGVDYLVIGNVKKEGNRYKATFVLYDVIKQQQLLEHSYASSNHRKVAHNISDDIYEKLTGKPGAFDTKILYVTSTRAAANKIRYKLNYADSDGFGAKTILNSSEPILSPSWSPDAKKVAYVNFSKGRPGIYIQDIYQGKRLRMTAFKGLNSAPAWSPDGRKLAMVLSKGGNPDIYIMDVATRQLRQITRHFAIDTEPSWMPDGQHLVFTSNRGGAPQIYQANVQTGKVKRLTFEGKYNARARVFPDGKSIAMVHKGEGIAQFNIAVLELDSGRLRLLTSTPLDESPSVAPNGSMLIYATQQRGRGVLAAVSADGAVKLTLPSSEGDVREPAWSPINK